MTNHPLSPEPGYYKNYILKVESNDPVGQLLKQEQLIKDMIGRVPEEKGIYAYAEGKWSIKELLGHLIDAERIFAYRALRFSRNDKTPLASFEENDYVEAASFNERTLASLLEEYSAVRKANIALYKSFNKEELKRTGTASNKELTVEQIIYITAGHEAHHIGILKERYGLV
jgi:uncharacterized damage-inducible protein DinB